MDVTIPLTGSAGLRPAWQRRAIAIAWAEIAVAAVAAVAVFGMAPPVNAVLALVALILGTAVFALLAAVSTAATRTVEMAQVTTLVPLGTAALGRRDTLEG